MSSHLVDDQPVRIDKITKEDTLQLRHSVLWPDMPLAQVILPEDALGIHYGAFLPHRGNPVAVISLFLEDQPIDNKDVDPGLRARRDSNSSPIPEERAIRFRKIACDPQYRGKGLGSQLLFHALSMARSELGVTAAWCDARTSTQEWYRKRGLHPFGDPFFKGPVGYIRMRIDLRNLDLEKADK
ncbi:acyl-CoA N-acyltransferase [Flammula alnicola]|nr:acyl-CoA N-acyltransferase [Flammula alnicola]